MAKMEGVGVIKLQARNQEYKPRANKRQCGLQLIGNANFAKQNCHLYFLRYADNTVNVC